MKIDLFEIAKSIRRTIIDTAHRSKSAHVGSCLSCVDILTALYFEQMQFNPWQTRDCFILSKAHAAMALYSTLVAKKIMKPSLLDGYFQNNGTLPAHLDRNPDLGIEVSAGSLGHGFNMGLGLAFGFKRNKTKRHVYVLIGDGECQEGSIWEGALFAPQLGINNFTAIMDHNNLQGYGRPTELCCFTPLRAKWEAFGWHVEEADGHDFLSLRKAFTADPCGKPKMIIAKTVKGKGVSFMEDQLIWHYYIVTDEHKKICHEELA